MESIGPSMPILWAMSYAGLVRRAANGQNAWERPACFRTALAVYLDLMFASTVKFVSLIGLYQIS